MNLTSINMIGWHRFPSELPTGFHEGNDEVMLALYKINQVIFDAIVIYPYKIRNVESGKYEYKKNSFMRFIPHERNKHDKMFNESGFYRSQVDNIKIYFEEYSRIQRDKSADTSNKDLFVFAMYYDFMSYAAQQLQGYLEQGVALAVTSRNLIEVIKQCDGNFILSVEQVSRGMIAIVRESLPELTYIKDFNSDYQVQ